MEKAFVSKGFFQTYYSRCLFCVKPQLGTRVGVIGMDVQPGEKGVVHVEGVFKMPKVTGVISMGTAVYLNSDGKVTTTETSNVPAGYVTADAASADAVACVKLLG